MGECMDESNIFGIIVKQLNQSLAWIGIWALQHVYDPWPHDLINENMYVSSAHD